MQRIVIGGRDHVASLPGSSRFVTPRRVAFMTMSQGTISKVSGMPRQLLAPVNYPDSDGEPMPDNTLQWVEVAICPQVVFEGLSPTNTRTELGQKCKVYARLGCGHVKIVDTADPVASEAGRVRGKLFAAGIDPDA